MEVECTQCGGRMLVEEISGVVACPHCGAHLAVPSSFASEGRSSVLTEIPADVGEVTQVGQPVDPPTGSVLQTSLPLEPSDQLPTPETTPAATSIPESDGSEIVNSDADASAGSAQSDMAARPVDAPDENENASICEQTETESPGESSSNAEMEMSTFPVLGEAARASDVSDLPTQTDSQPVNSLPTDSAAADDTSFPSVTTGDLPEEPSAGSVSVSFDEETPSAAVGPAFTTDKSQTVAHRPPTSQTPRGGSRFLFVLVVSYASAATLAIILLIVSLLRARQHSLESLPDLKPPVHNGKTAFQLVPAEAPMPPGHLLRLGQSQRYGSLRVTPLRVTRGPVEFVYFSDEPGHRRPPTPPTLKLWLRFENVSADQTFAPLGRDLVLTRVANKHATDHLLANNFVCRADDKRRDGHHILLFDLSRDSNWDLRDQNVDRVLKPGEVLETYLASEAEGLDELTGKLIWRVQFRKGYNRQSKRGVTTLIEVRFSSDEIQPDATG